MFENSLIAGLKQFQEIYGLELVMEGEEFKQQRLPANCPDTRKALNILSKTFGLEAMPYQYRIYFISNP